MRHLLFCVVFCVASIALADLPAPPTIAEMGECVPEKQRRPTDTDCSACAISDACENTLAPKGYERRCEVKLRGYTNSVWCQGAPTSAPVKADEKPSKQEKGGGCAVGTGGSLGGVLVFSALAVMLFARRRPRCSYPR